MVRLQRTLCMTHVLTLASDMQKVSALFNTGFVCFRLLGAVAKDSNLLTTGCSLAPELQWEAVKLFRRFPELQEAMDALPSRSALKQEQT